MSEIKFSPGKSDGEAWVEAGFPECAHLVYLSVHPGVDESPISGWVAPQVHALIHAAPDLLAAVRKWVSECAECDGTGIIHVKQWPGGIEVDGERDCDQCEDIRDVVAKATVTP